ncbi:MAG TPA: hypothetical protein VK175_12610 [Leadbetterella sp.]|nr:hypothetical protein [Leadbetterella sp.]
MKRFPHVFRPFFEKNKLLKGKKNILLWLLILVPVVIHLIVLDKFSINFPFEDGHRVFLDFSYNYLNAEKISDKIILFFTPDNESRPFLIRISLLIQLALFDKINFRYLLIAFNVYTFILVAIFIRRYWKSPPLLIVCSFSLLSLCNWELFFRSDVASYQLASISLSILVFYLISNNPSGKSFIKNSIILVCLFLVPFGSAVGFITVFFVLVYAIIRKTNPKWYFILSLFILQLYLYYSFGTENATSDGLFQNVLKYKFELIWAYFMSLGGVFQLMSNSISFTISGIFGIIIFTVCSWFLLRNWKQKDLDFEKLVFLFMASSLAIIVLNRYNYWVIGYESVLVPRYKIYGVIILILAISFVFKQVNTRFIKNSLPIGVICLYVFWLLKSWYSVTLKKETQMMDAYNLEKNMVRNERANNTFEARYKYDYLKKNGYFDASELYNEVLNMVQNGTVVYPEKVVLKYVDFDPTFESDWGGKNTILNKIFVSGKFPVSDTYFIQLIDKNNKAIILNGFRRPNSVLKRLVAKERQIDFLSKEFEMEYFKLEKPLTCRVICINPVYSVSK